MRISFSFLRGTLCWAIVGSSLLFNPRSSAADVLDQLLRENSQPVLRVSRPETVALWTNLLEASEGTQTNRIRMLAEQFGGANDVTEPYQKDFAASVLEVLDLCQGQWVPVDTDKKRAELKAQQSIEADLRQSLENANTERAAAAKEVEAQESKLHSAGKAHSIARGILDIFGPHPVGVASDTAVAVIQQDLQRAQNRLAKADQKLADLNAQLGQLLQSMPDLDKYIDAKLGEHILAVRNGVVARVRQLTRDGYPRAALALANMYVRFIANDSDVIREASIASEMHKKQVRATEIAGVVAKEANELLTQVRPWSAKKSIEEAGSRIRELVQKDQELALMVARELGGVRRRAEDKIESIMKLRDGIFERSKTDSKVLDKFEEFAHDYPDYPNIEADRSKLVVQEYQAEIDAIKAILVAQPLQAYERLQKVAVKLTDRHADVLKAQITQMTDQILDTAVTTLRKRLDDALELRLKADSVQDRTAKARLMARATEEEEAVFAEAKAWLNQPMNDVTKTRFNSIVKQGPVPTPPKPGFDNLLPPNSTTLILVALAAVVVWLLLGRRRIPAKVA